MARVEINNEEDLERWLNSLPEDRRRQVAVAIAYRAALRAVPVLEAWLRRDEARATAIVLPVFRAIAATWFAASSTVHTTELLEAAAAIHATARTATDRTAASAIRAAARAADTATAPAFVSELFITIAGDSTAAAADSATFVAFDFRRTAFAASDARTTTWGAVEIDIDTIVNSEAVTTLMSSPIWPQGTPDWAQELWASMKRRLLAREGEHWEVWTNWYDARLDPSKPIPCYRPPVPELERARVLLPEDLWNQGPAAVNGEIKRLIEEHACSDSDKGKHVEKAAEMASPQPYLNENKQLDVRPNPKYDCPEVDDELVELPIRQRKIIRGLLAELESANGNRNVPPIVIKALKEYDAELAGRGLQPLLGLLKDQADILRAAVGGHEEDYGWCSKGAQAAFKRFFENHERIVAHFPLDKVREQEYAKIPVLEEELIGGEFRKIVAAFAKEMADLYENGYIVTSNYFIALDKLREISDILQGLPYVLSEEGKDSLLKRVYLQFLGFVERTRKAIGQWENTEKIVREIWELIEKLKDFLG